MRIRGALPVLVAALVLPALPGCGGDDGRAAGAADGEKPVLTVSAAASLKRAFTQYGQSFDAARVRFSFAGSDELAAQIRRGVRPDVYAAANTALPERLHAEGLVEKPVVFAGNRLVIAVAAGSSIAAVGDLARPGTKIVMGKEGVPVGDYARRVVDRLPPAEAKRILANVKSEEPDVRGVVGKLVQGAADAGLVYATDVEAASGDLKAVDLPEELQPGVGYAAAVVAGARQPAAAAFVSGLLGAEGQAALQDAGFAPPPAL